MTQPLPASWRRRFAAGAIALAALSSVATSRVPVSRIAESSREATLRLSAASPEVQLRVKLRYDPRLLSRRVAKNISVATNFDVTTNISAGDNPWGSSLRLSIPLTEDSVLPAQIVVMILSEAQGRRAVAEPVEEPSGRVLRAEYPLLLDCPEFRAQPCEESFSILFAWKDPAAAGEVEVPWTLQAVLRGYEEPKTPEEARKALSLTIE
jgi:hypothetical protein